MKDLVSVIDDASAWSEAIHDAVTRVSKSIVDNVTGEGIFWAVIYVITKSVDCRRALLTFWKRIEEEWEAEFVGKFGRGP